MNYVYVLLMSLVRYSVVRVLLFLFRFCYIPVFTPTQLGLLLPFFQFPFSLFSICSEHWKKGDFSMLRADWKKGKRNWKKGLRPLYFNIQQQGIQTNKSKINILVCQRMTFPFFQFPFFNHMWRTAWLYIIRTVGKREIRNEFIKLTIVEINEL